jgi:hypothetical protein
VAVVLGHRRTGAVDDDDVFHEISCSVRLAAERAEARE